MSRVLLIVALVCAPTRARAEPLVPPSPTADAEPKRYRWYGVGGGVAAHLAPADALGGWVQASAAIDFTRGRGHALLAARGTLSALFHGDGWAVLPLLSSDVGVRLGPLDLFLSGGVQIFGFARRDAFTVFASFGVVGGGGFAVRLGAKLRLSLRAQLVWLPSRAAARIDAAEDAAKPTFLYLGGALMLELRQLFSEGL